MTASGIIPDQAWGRETEARGRASQTNSDNEDKQASNSRLTFLTGLWHNW